MSEISDGKGEHNPGCQFCYWEVVRFAAMDYVVPIGRMAYDAAKHCIQTVKSTLPESGPKSLPPAKPNPNLPANLNLEPGDLVEVRSFEEIQGMLDERQRTNGLVFMPHMAQDCGKRFRVHKKVEHIRLETTGQMRKIRSPTVFLEGSVCNACDRACYCFWRESWLKRVEKDAS